MLFLRRILVWQSMIEKGFFRVSLMNEDGLKRAYCLSVVRYQIILSNQYTVYRVCDPEFTLKMKFSSIYCY